MFNMVNARSIACALLVAASSCQAVIFKPQNDFKAISASNSSVSIDLRPFFNNRAFGLSPNDSSFDGQGSKKTRVFDFDDQFLNLTLFCSRFIPGKGNPTGEFRLRWC